METTMEQPIKTGATWGTSLVYISAKSAWFDVRPGLRDRVDYDREGMNEVNFQDHWYFGMALMRFCEIVENAGGRIKAVTQITVEDFE